MDVVILVFVLFTQISNRMHFLSRSILGHVNCPNVDPLSLFTTTSSSIVLQICIPFLFLTKSLFYSLLYLSCTSVCGTMWLFYNICKGIMLIYLVSSLQSPPPKRGWRRANQKNLRRLNWSREVSARFLLIFTVAFLLFLAPVWGFNPAGHSITIT